MSRRTVVAATKLATPSARPGFVPRPQLIERLDGDYRVALVSAPAGYGKTATLASWATGLDQPLAWLSCDASDIEPTRFMTCLLSSISRVWPGAADDAFVLLERERSTYDAAVAVANELAAVDEPGVIVVDDLHLASPHPETLAAFVRALPHHFRFVAGTRADPPLSLGRLRLSGELLELRSDDLRFDDDEVATFLELQQIPLSGPDRLRLHHFTEGWPAGVQLAGIALQRGAARDDLMEAFARTERSVSDFLLTEVLAKLPDDLVDFLMATSVFDAFDAPLGAAVTGRDDAATVLERLVAADLFLVPLDDRTSWYRYHQLFGAFLRARLASLGETRVRAAHDRAGRALEARGDVAGALQHAMALDDSERVGEVLHAAIAQSMSLSDRAGVSAEAIRLWLHHHGAAAVRTDPRNVLELLVGLITIGAPEDAPMWLDRIQQAHGDADGELLAYIEGCWGEYHQHRGEPLRAIAHLEAAMDALGGRPPSEGIVSQLHVASARAYLQAGRLGRAAEIADHALSNPVGNPLADQVRHRAIAAFVASSTGDLHRADELAEHALVAADALDLGRPEPGRIFAGLARAQVLVERGDHDDDAARLLDDIEQAGVATHRVTLQVTVALARARAARAFGDEAEAEAALERARVLQPMPDAALRGLVAEEAAMHALRFDPERAAALIAPLDGARRTTQVLQTRLALLDGDGRAAAALLAELPPAEDRRARVEQGVLCALSELGRDVDRANVHLRAAFREGRPERLVRSIVQLGPDVHHLLKSYVPDPDEDEYLDDLLAVAGRVVAPVRARTASALVDPLSEREVTVLRYLCSHLTNQEIAAALFVSLNTLKSHVRSVYRKLGATSRAEAVDAGRRHGLV